ncbi:MAG: phytoene desaturase [Bacteroidetes bacterium]|nr:phytoene desaturase [Bacteroidota bacterium]
MSKDIVVIGAGFAGLTTAALLGQAGYRVTLLEKNSTPGGRARSWSDQGYTFDMGPSWYWMPEVFENLYARFGKTTSDFYDLVRLDPGYRVYFGEKDFIDVPAGMNELEQLFDQLEPGSVPRLRSFLAQAEQKYRTGMSDFVFRPSLSITEFMDFRLIREAFRIQIFRSLRRHVRELFHHPRLITLLEFPVLFLGATPSNTPALYSMMNYADLVLGTWYPMGGMGKIVDALVQLCHENGVDIRLNEPVQKLETNGKTVTAVVTSSARYTPSLVVSGADYHHTDQQLLPEESAGYTPSYWESRVMSPSSLLFYIGLNRKLDGVIHHTLFFDESFDAHADDIYTSPAWPKRPLFYTSAASVTDPAVAPPGGEALVILIPLAPGLQDSEMERERQYQIVMDRFESLTGQKIRDHVVTKRSYAMTDFSRDYHSFKGNAYGLANTLSQTAILKPRLRSAKLRNLFFTGQLTVPGPGVPPSLISGQVVAGLIEKEYPI